MIVLDTNVVSEFARPAPLPVVVDWVDRLPSADIRTTAITAAELAAGIAGMPIGRRRARIADVVARQLTIAFAGRILSFDLDCAEFYGETIARRRRSGRPIGQLDAQIAAICLRYDAVLATRNVRDFDDTGVTVVNPWDAQQR